MQRGTSLEAFVCCFHISPTTLIEGPQAERLMNGKTPPRSYLPWVQGSRLQVTWAFSMALPALGTALPNQTLEEEQKYSSRGNL